jgi:GNAT superfamily N-acetyltransferase
VERVAGRPYNTRTVSIRIRPATVSDVPLILDLIRGLAEYEKLASQCVATESLLCENLFGPRPYAETLIGELDGVGVGFALFFHNFSTFLARPGIYLEDVFVRPEHRGAGVGKALLQAVARIAVERNCGRFEWSVLDWNEPAIGFYKSRGAQVLPDWRICRVSGEALHRLAAGE